MLETHRLVGEADELADAAANGSLMRRMSPFTPGKHERFTIKVSDLGRELWESAQPDLHDFQIPEQRD